MIHDTDKKLLKRYRHCSDFAFALAVVDKNIAGFESLGANWF